MWQEYTKPHAYLDAQLKVPKPEAPPSTLDVVESVLEFAIFLPQSQSWDYSNISLSLA